jgi:transglutaminase-like putative cysteine protease
MPALTGFLCLVFSIVSGTALAEAEAPPSGAPGSVTIEHIADGIRAHIAQESHRHDGKFRVEHEGKALDLELIRVHMEYLANLGNGVQFACVDLVATDGTVYDVDFFLSGTEPDRLAVTETHVHKRDGQPLYAWEQKPSGIWHRIPVEQAGDELLGVRRESDAFTFRYRFEIPALEAPGRIWLPLARSDAFQKVRVARIETPAPWEIVDDARGDNQAVFMEVAPGDSGATVEIVYEVERRESGPYAEEGGRPPGDHLAPESKVPAAANFAAIAQDVLSKTEAPTDLMRARELYNHTMKEMRYQRYGEGWGAGDALRACDAKSGNCTDFHAYFIALSRASGIPARFVIGAAIPSERDEGGIDGYHCWAEFYADGRWWPVDLSEANKNLKLADYYFGKKPANRFELSRGRDIVFPSAPLAEPLNFLIYPVVESGGKVTVHRPVFEFLRQAEARRAAAAPVDEPRVTDPS